MIITVDEDLPDAPADGLSPSPVRAPARDLPPELPVALLPPLPMPMIGVASGEAVDEFAGVN
ncbi:MAG: hypothetical protein FJX76_24435 [Armatimonadetes bacterium]|nr:hypothetical protein [Armatimonadota bacterium]